MGERYIIYVSEMSEVKYYMNMHSIDAIAYSASWARDIVKMYVATNRDGVKYVFVFAYLYLNLAYLYLIF